MRSQQVNWLHYLTEAADRSLGYVRSNLQVIGRLGLVGFPGVYPFVRAVWPDAYESLALRLVAAALCLPLLFDKHMPVSWERILPVYWCCSCAFVFPVMFGVVLIVNSAQAETVGETEYIWLAQYLIALFLFVQLINNAILATLLWLISIAIVSLVPFALVDPNWQEVQNVFFNSLLAFLTAVLAGSLTARHVELVHQHRLDAVYAIGANVAHELRTPLLGIRTRARGTKKHLKQLVDGYRWAKERCPDLDDFPDSRMGLLYSTFDDISLEAEHSNTLINILLMNSRRPKVMGESDVWVLMSDCIADTLRRFPFANQKEKGLVVVEVRRDFEVQASSILIIHILFNLLKNALFYVQRNPEGVVTVTVGNRDGEVEVHDTGPGIKKQIQRRIFERFFTTTTAGTGSGIGLSFCRQAMKELGGDIRCESEPGNYAKFTLEFPPGRVDLCGSSQIAKSANPR